MKGLNMTTRKERTEKLRTEMQNKIKAAINEFSKMTGVSVNSVEWDIAIANDENGKVVASAYCEFRSDCGEKYNKSAWMC